MGVGFECFDEGCWATDSSPSSPEASREEGWSISAVADLGISVASRWEELRFRLDEADDGDDMAGELNAPCLCLRVERSVAVKEC